MKRTRFKDYPSELRDADWLRRRYVTENFSAEAIAEGLTVPTAAVRPCYKTATPQSAEGRMSSNLFRSIRLESTRDASRRKGAVANAIRHRSKRPRELDNKQWLWNRYVIDGKTYNEIAKELKVTFLQVKSAMKYFKIVRPPDYPTTTRGRIRWRLLQQANQKEN